MDPLTITQHLGLSPEHSAALITIGALSTSFYILWNFIKTPFDRALTALSNYFIREINLHISEPDYNKINLWLEQHSQYIKFQRTYKVVNSSGHSEADADYEYDSNTSVKQQNRLISGFGTIMVFAPKHPIMLINRVKEESKQIYQQTESISIRFITLHPSRILKFFDEVTNITEDNIPYVWDSPDRWWQRRGVPRPVSEPVGDGAVKMITSVDDFINARDNYKHKKIPYKRGFLLHGEPGTGKTSILSYIAQKHNLHMYIIDSDAISNITSLVGNIKPNSMLILEDLDLSILGQSRVSGGDGTDNVDSTSLTNKDALNAFLNTLDGLVEINASIICATSNNPSVLDPALLRPGRIDEVIEIGLLNHHDQLTHVNNFFDTDYTANANIPDRTFAELQLICTKHMLNVDAALIELQEPRTNNIISKNHIGK